MADLQISDDRARTFAEGLQKFDKDGDVAQPGGRSKVTARLAKGTYTFYCPVDGHEAGGMKGTLVVG